MSFIFLWLFSYPYEGPVWSEFHRSPLEIHATCDNNRCYGPNHNLPGFPRQ